jgi:hypothetical protein
VVNTYELIEKQLGIAFISLDVKQLFENKLKSFYLCRLRYPVKRISEIIAKHPHVGDHVSATLIQFYNYKELAYKEPEDY